jgi:hypothetical protein
MRECMVFKRIEQTIYDIIRRDYDHNGCGYSDIDEQVLVCQKNLWSVEVRQNIHGFINAELNILIFVYICTEKLQIYESLYNFGIQTDAYFPDTNIYIWKSSDINS